MTASACLTAGSLGLASRAASRDCSASGSSPQDLYSAPAAMRVSACRGSSAKAFEKQAKACAGTCHCFSTYSEGRMRAQHVKSRHFWSNTLIDHAHAGIRFLVHVS